MNADIKYAQNKEGKKKFGKEELIYSVQASSSKFKWQHVESF